MEERKRNGKWPERAKGHGKKEGAAPEAHFKPLPLLSLFSLACEPEVCAVTQSARGCWQPARSWPRALTAVRSALWGAGKLPRAPFLGFAEDQHHLAGGDTALQQTKPARLQSWLGSWVQ